MTMAWYGFLAKFGFSFSFRRLPLPFLAGTEKISKDYRQKLVRYKISCIMYYLLCIVMYYPESVLSTVETYYSQ